MSLSLSPLIRFGTSTWTYEGWQGQIYNAPSIGEFAGRRGGSGSVAARK
jgi:hypothetical protein